MPLLGDVPKRDTLRFGEVWRDFRRRHHERTHTLRVRTATARAPATRLGERLRQLRVAAGLTQSELAGERFSKEYVSQIERGKTRPTPRDDRVARRAARRRPGLPRERRLDRRARPRRGGARAGRGARRGHRTDEARREYETRPARRRARPARSSSRCARSSGEAVGAACGSATSAPALELLTRRASSSRAPVLRPRARRRALPARRLPLQALEHLHRARALQRGARARRALRAARATSCARRSSAGARAATGASATSRPRARTSSARSSSPRALEDRRTIANAYFQASLVAEREGHWVLARTLRRAGEEPVRGARRTSARRPAAEQPRRAQPHARQAPRRRSST